MSDYTILRAADAPDYTGGGPEPVPRLRPPDRAPAGRLNIRDIAPGDLSRPAGADPAGGHSHKHHRGALPADRGRAQDQGRDDVVTLGPRDAVLIQRRTSKRAARNVGDEEGRARHGVDTRSRTRWPSPTCTRGSGQGRKISLVAQGTNRVGAMRPAASCFRGRTSGRLLLERLVAEGVRYGRDFALVRINVPLGSAEAVSTVLSGLPARRQRGRPLGGRRAARAAAGD